MTYECVMEVEATDEGTAAYREKERLVRCKDCERKTVQEGEILCHRGRFWIPTPPDGFCHLGRLEKETGVES